MKIRYRWYGPIHHAPMIGCYLCSGWRARRGYLIINVDNRGKRGGLGAEMHHLLVLTVERVTAEEARGSPECYRIIWDKRGHK